MYFKTIFYEFCSFKKKNKKKKTRPSLKVMNAPATCNCDLDLDLKSKLVKDNIMLNMCVNLYQNQFTKNAAETLTMDLKLWIANLLFIHLCKVISKSVNK